MAVATAKFEAARLLADTPPANPTVGCGRLCDSDFWGTHNFRTGKYENVADAFEVKSEIKRGADVNAQNAQGSTPLCEAVLLPNPLLTALLLEQGADPNVGNCYQGSMPLHFAVQNNDPSAAEMVVALLLDYGADISAEVEGWTPLHAAAAWGESNVIDVLLNYGADVSVVSEFDIFGYEKGYDGWPAYGTQPLHMAAALNKDPKVSAMLLDWGADINGLARGLSPLHLSVGRNENLAVASLLLDRGADVNAGDNSWTPLHYAASYPIEGINQERSVGAIKLLVENGADVNARSDYGITPLHQAVRLLPDGKVIEILLERGADVDASDVNGNTPLHLAVSQRRPNRDVINLLLIKGADVNAHTWDGNTPLHIVVDDLLRPESYIIELVIELLLNHGADITAHNNDGATPCAIAEEAFWPLDDYAHEDILKLLCE